jgi:CheY-like chemotaxis protein
MNGFEVCQRLEQDPATASVPVIVVTALGQIRSKEATRPGQVT